MSGHADCDELRREADVQRGRIIGEIRDSGTTVFLVEQNASQALRIADRGYVMENGRIAFSDSAHNLLHDERVRAVYLGESVEDA